MPAGVGGHPVCEFEMLDSRDHAGVANRPNLRENDRTNVEGESVPSQVLPGFDVVRWMKSMFLPTSHSMTSAIF